MSEHSRALRKYDDVGAPVNNARVLELGFDKGGAGYPKSG